jgi:hypothetical protein
MLSIFWLHMKKFLLTLLLLVMLASLFSSHALAYGIFTGGQTGYDISYPQGSNPLLTSSYAFLVVGTTDGRAYTDNPYFGSQTVLSQGKTLSLYMNLNAPVGSTVKGNITTPKSCSKNDKICQAYNYGYNAAEHSYRYAQGKGASSTMWWLDIEIGNSWATNTTINDATIQGTVDFFNQQGVIVGIYSTQSMWNSIAGSSFTPLQTRTSVVPNWIPGASSTNPQSSCSQKITVNGQVWLTQYVSNGFDHDYACL